MYERISRELEHERATASQLRRDLDAKSAETAEQRRSVASAATNGVHTTTDERPVAVDPGRPRRAGGPRRCSPRGPRPTPARPTGAPRPPARRPRSACPEHEQSATGVWVARAAALALVALLLIALIIIVSALA